MKGFLFGFMALALVACSSAEKTSTDSDGNKPSTSDRDKNDDDDDDGKKPTPKPDDDKPTGKKIGEECKKDEDCSTNGGCLFKTGATFGYCSATCESWSDCPSFWKCEEVANASSKYCIKP
jgi:hypothetical protein